LIGATGWLAHTTLIGLRKRGCAVAVDRSNKERGSIYRIISNQNIEALAGRPNTVQ
jgi:hypothetical protein